MELSRYDKLIYIESKIQYALQKGQLLKAKSLKMRYNWALGSLRKQGPTDIPLYSIHDFSNIHRRNWIVNYEQECGFCGARECLETVHMSTGNIRTIRVCSSERCRSLSRRYLLFKKGWIKPEFHNPSIFRLLLKPIASILSLIQSQLF